MELTRQLTVNTAYRILFLALQLIVNILFSRLTGPEGFGLFSLILANVTFLVIFTSLGIPSGIMFHAARNDFKLSSLQRIIYFSSLAQLVLVILFDFLYLRIKGQHWLWPSGQLSIGWWGILFFVSTVLNEKYYSLFNGLGRLVKYNTTMVAISLLSAICLSAFLMLEKSPPANTVIGFRIMVSILEVIFLAMVSFTFARSRSVSLPVTNTASGFMNYSLQSYVSNSIQFLANRIDFWILVYFYNQKELGFYALAVKIGQLLLILPLLFAAVFLPVITSANFQKEQLERQIRLLNTFNLAAILVMSTSAFLVVPLVFGDAFRPSILPLVYLLPGLLFLGMSTLLSAYFAGKGKVIINIKNSLICLVLVFILDLLFIPRFGSRGAAAASSITYILIGTYALIQYCRMEGYNVTSVMANRNDIIWAKESIRHLMASKPRLF